MLKLYGYTDLQEYNFECLKYNYKLNIKCMVFKYDLE